MSATRLYLAQLINAPSREVQRTALPSEAFQGGERDIYRAVRAVAADHPVVTMEAVIAELREAGRLDAAGGHDHVDALTDLLGAHTLDGARVEVVADATKRILTDAARASHSLATASKSREASEAMRTALRAVEAMQGAGNGVALKSERQHFTAWMEKLRSGDSIPFNVELGALSQIGAVFPGALGLIYGFSQAGKSFVMQWLERRYLDAGHATLRVSCEDPEHVIAGRLVSERTGASAMDGGASLTNDMTRRISAACAGINESWDRRYVVEHEPDVTAICATIRTAAIDHGVRVVFVDYAQLLRMAGHMSEEGQERQISHSTAMLKDVSKEVGVMLWLGSQVTVRDPKPGKVYVPSPFDLKGARSLYEMAELALAVWKVDDETRLAEVQKNKITGQLPKARVMVGPGGVVTGMEPYQETQSKGQRGYGAYGRGDYQDA